MAAGTALHAPFRTFPVAATALILVAAERAEDSRKAGLPPRHGRECRDPDGQPDGGFTCSRAFRGAGPTAFAEAGITHKDVDHRMIYDALAHLPSYGLEDLGFVPRGEAGAFIAERNTAPGGRLPLNTAGERAPDARHRPRSDPRR